MVEDDGELLEHDMSMEENDGVLELFMTVLPSKKRWRKMFLQIDY